LAHIRRHDYLVNLGQTLIETIFFYHPAVWWLSHQIRCERENCCDGIVVSVIGNRLDYSRALLALEELRGTPTPLALGANGGSLVSRVRRLFGGEPAPTRVSNGSIAIAVVLIVGMLALLLIAEIGRSSDAAKKEKDSVNAAPASLVAKLPGGIEIELAGMTRNTAPAKEGWRPNGSPKSDVSGWKVHLVTQEGETTEATTQNDPRADRDARDLLLHLRGLQGQRPSIFISTPSGRLSGGQWLPNDDPFQIRLPVGRQERFQVSSSRGGPLKKEVLLRTWQPQPEDPLLTIGITVAPWGTPVKIRPDGVILNPTQPGDLYAETDKLVEVLQAVTTNGSWITIRQPPANVDPVNRLHAYDFEFYAIDTEGGRHTTDWRQEFPNGKYDVWVSSHGGFNELPEGKTLSHYEYRVRPYRDWVTFSGLAMEPGKMTKAKVIRSSYDPPQREAEQNPVVVKLPAGLEIELVGITQNAASPAEGWSIDGSPLGDVGDGPRAATVSINEGRLSISTGEPAAGQPPSLLARDLLFECRGLRSPPSGVVLGRPGWNKFQTLATAEAYRKRLSDLPEESDQILKFEMTLTDSPWGPWQSINKTGQRVGTVAIDEADRAFYDDMQVVRVGLVAGVSPEAPAMELVLDEPATHEDYFSGVCDMSVRFVGTDGKTWPTDAMRESSKPGRRVLRWQTALSVSPDKIDHGEFRLRPYRHFITFENVPLNRQPGRRVVVKQRSLPEPVGPPSDPRYTAKISSGIEIELLRIVRNDLPAEKSWLPDGGPAPSGVEWPERRGFQVNPGGGYSYSSDPPGSDRVWDFLYDVRSAGVEPYMSVTPVDGWASSSQSVPVIGPRLITLLPNDPKELTYLSLRIGTGPWGEWVQVDPSGEIAHAEAIREQLQTPQYRFVELVDAGMDELNLDRSFIRWNFARQPSELVQIEQRAITDDGRTIRSNFSLIGLGKNPTYEITEYFNVPLSEVKRFEYRVRPYQHLVTFENVSLDPEKKTEKKTEVKVSVLPLAPLSPDGRLK